jgi:hypothetical protein
MNQYAFELGQQVAIRASGEQGQVVGRGEYTNAANTYFVRYRCADGRAVETWWSEDALDPVVTE